MSESVTDSTATACGEPIPVLAVARTDTAEPATSLAEQDETQK